MPRLVDHCVSIVSMIHPSVKEEYSLRDSFRMHADMFSRRGGRTAFYGTSVQRPLGPDPVGVHPFGSSRMACILPGGPDEGPLNRQVFMPWPPAVPQAWERLFSGYTLEGSSDYYSARAVHLPAYVPQGSRHRDWPGVLPGHGMFASVTHAPRLDGVTLVFKPLLFQKRAPRVRADVFGPRSFELDGYSYVGEAPTWEVPLTAAHVKAQGLAATAASKRCEGRVAGHSIFMANDYGPACATHVFVREDKLLADMFRIPPGGLVLDSNPEYIRVVVRLLAPIALNAEASTIYGAGYWKFPHESSQLPRYPNPGELVQYLRERWSGPDPSWLQVQLMTPTLGFIRLLGTLFSAYAENGDLLGEEALSQPNCGCLYPSLCDLRMGSGVMLGYPGAEIEVLGGLSSPTAPASVARMVEMPPCNSLNVTRWPRTEAAQREGEGVSLSHSMQGRALQYAYASLTCLRYRAARVRGMRHVTVGRILAPRCGIFYAVFTVS